MKEKPVTNDDFPIDQFIIWRKHDAIDQQFNEWIGKLEIDLKTNNKLELTRYYTHCDNN